MNRLNLSRIPLVLTLLGSSLPALAADDALDKSFEKLKTYDWGQDSKIVKPI